MHPTFPARTKMLDTLTAPQKADVIGIGAPQHDDSRQDVFRFDHAQAVVPTWFEACWSDGPFFRSH